MSPKSLRPLIPSPLELSLALPACALPRKAPPRDRLRPKIQWHPKNMYRDSSTRGVPASARLVPLFLHRQPQGQLTRGWLWEAGRSDRNGHPIFPW